MCTLDIFFFFEVYCKGDRLVCLFIHSQSLLQEEEDKDLGDFEKNWKFDFDEGEKE